ncbi:MAG: hypothetical protein KDB69_09590 [Acidimicrobiia bacterium]|nr:hypothetical protein [Acidimicrobiia bacterium]
MVGPSANGKRPFHDIEPYRRLNTSTRRRAGVVYLVMAVVAGGIVWLAGGGVLWYSIVVPIVALAVVQFVAGWRMRVTDMEAIRIAAEATSFEVGHASGSLGFRGILAKPVWSVLAYGAGPSPSMQAVVAVDAIDGVVLGIHEEPVEAV